MNHARKMILIEPEALERMQVPTSAPNHNAVSRIDQNMSAILEDPNLADFDKWKQYNDQLQRFFQKMSLSRKPVQLDLQPGDDTVQRAADPVRSQTILAAPKTFQRKAEALYDRLRQADVITWDNRGEVTIAGNLIPTSNITDLIGDAIRDRKQFNPVGAVTFMRTLKDLHIPMEFIGNMRRWRAAAQTGAGASSPSSPWASDENNQFKTTSLRRKGSVQARPRTTSCGLTSWCRY